MTIHQKCLKSSKYASFNDKLPSKRELQILKFVNSHDNYKLKDIREAIWPGLLDRCYKSLDYYNKLYGNMFIANPARIDALAKHMVSGYGSGIIAKMVKRGYLVYDTQYRWHITEYGVSKIISHELAA